MKNRCINLILILIIVLSNIILVIDIDNIKFADAKEDKFSSMIGVKQVIANNVDTTYTGRNWLDSKGKIQYEYKAVINQAPIYNNNGSLVDCSWHQTSQDVYTETNESKIDLKGKNVSVVVQQLVSPASYVIKDNVFSATVTGSAISTTYQGQIMSWNPVVLIDSKQYVANGSPRVLAVDPINSNYCNNVLEWNYSVCVRRVRVIEGLIQETWIFNQDPKGTVWIKDNSTKTAGFTWAISPYAYDANNNPLPVNEYKQVSAKDMASATYPVVIDPTEVYVDTADDNWNYVNNADYASAWGGGGYGAYGGTTATTGQSWVSGSGYLVKRAFIYFDTSAIPDSALLTAVNLSLYVTSVTTQTQTYNLTVQSGMPTYPSEPPASGDFNKAYYSGDGGNKTSASFTTSAYNNISFSATGISWINKIGTTKFALRTSADIAGTACGGCCATNYNDVTFYTYEQGAGYRPTLYVTYTTVSQPVVTTMPATLITSSGAQLNGYVNDGGGENDQYIFYYGLTPSYGTDTGWTGSVATNDLFSANISGLTPGIHYHFNSSIKNSGYTAVGNDTAFITLPVKPSSFSVVGINSSTHNVSWVKGTGAVNTMVRRSNVSYPINTSSGTLVYNGSALYNLSTGLIDGQTYYYSGWSFASDGGLTAFSSDYATCSAIASNFSVRTDAATLVGETSAKLNGYVAATNGSSTIRFWYDTDSGSPYANNTSWGGAYTQGQYPNVSLSSLSYGQIYYFIISMNRSGFVVNGSEMSFLTKPDRPYTLSATTISDIRISLSWTKGSGAYRTLVKYATTGYPTLLTGTQIYYDTETSYEHVGLTGGTEYFYRVWSEVTSGGLQQYSDTWDDESETTGNTSSSYGDDIFPHVTIDPLVWYGDETDIPNIPMRDMFIDAAAKIGCNPKVLMSAAAIGLTMAVSVSIFLFSGSIFLAIMASMIMMIGGYWTGMLPVWMIIIFIVGAISAYYVLRRV